ncbi:hypothetical protein ONE63_005080 [Megalurothrips usitatus]|uniref:Retrovirus-related Pol polyprotein from transposon TNT 1-94 n=1 Tax=Megalurothrips usitatus TaxID=439358 RepID=A0AAV7XUW4_9NEOP|nr:hypothetical protein ONE63_005080 [Megalurothrips usitatus]
MPSAPNLPAEDKLEGAGDYANWKFAMELMLRHDRCWEAVMGEGNQDMNERARTKICLNVKPSVYPHVRDHQTAKGVWDSLEKVFNDKSTVRRMTIQRSLHRIQLESFSNIEAYLTEIKSGCQTLSDLGSPMDDQAICDVILGGLTSDYAPMIMALDGAGRTLTSEELTSTLMTSRIKKSETPEAAALYSSQRNEQNQQQTNIVCYNCGHPYHIAKDCKKNTKKEQNQKNNHYKSNKQKKPSSTKKSGESGFVVLSEDESDKERTLYTVALFTDKPKTKPARDGWFIDSGASSHMTCESDHLEKIQFIGDREIMAADDGKLACNSIGEMRLRHRTGEQKFGNVLHVPTLAVNLLSVGKMAENGCTLVFDNHGCRVYSQKVVEPPNPLMSASKDGALYKLDMPETAFKTTDWLWHRRLGHPSLQVLKKTKESVTGIGTLPSEDHCRTCLEGKMARLPFPKGGSTPAAEKLKLVHSDLCGPISPASWSGMRYVLTFTDDCTRKVLVYFLKHKSETFEKFQEFKSRMELESGNKLKCLRTDNDKVYLSTECQEFLKNHGISHETTVEYTPEQNGVSERMNRTLLDKARTMLLDAGLDQRYWAEAVSTSVYLRNRLETAPLPGTTPEEAWSGKPVDVSHLRIFGCDAYAHIPKEKRGKLDPKAERYIFLGYCEKSKAYRLGSVSNPTKTIKARDVRFIEDTEEGQDVLQDYVSDQTPDEQKNPAAPEEIVTPNIQPKATTNISKNSDSQMQLAPRYPSRQRKEVRDPDFIYFTDLAYFSAGNEPSTVEEALASEDSPQWERAMSEELAALRENETWDIVARPVGSNVVQCKWVFKIKCGSDGSAQRYKARLVARGFSQRQGIDYNETFAPVARHTTLRLLFATAADNPREILTLKEKLQESFKIRDLGPIQDCLGVKVCQSDAGTILLNQEGYIDKLLLRYGLSDCKPACTPLQENQHLMPTEVCPNYPYQELIGGLMYLSILTRPDITYAVSYLSQFHHGYSEAHWTAAKRVLRYLKGTKNFSLIFRKGQPEPVGFADADWGGDHVDRKSFTGFVFTVSHAAVSWEARKQRAVALSSTEAEYIALCEASKEALYLRGLICELELHQQENFSITIHNDSQSAQSLCHNPVFHKRSKHIDIRFHFVRECVDSNLVTLKYLPTSAMPADALTKALGTFKLHRCIQKVGLLKP